MESSRQAGEFLRLPEDPEERAAMLRRLLAETDEKLPKRVLVLRVPRDLLEAIRRGACQARQSMNAWCCDKLEQAVAMGEID